MRELIIKYNSTSHDGIIICRVANQKCCTKQKNKFVNSSLIELLLHIIYSKLVSPAIGDSE